VKLPKFFARTSSFLTRYRFSELAFVFLLLAGSFLAWFWYTQRSVDTLQKNYDALVELRAKTSLELEQTKTQLFETTEQLRIATSEDQIVRNNTLQKEINQIQTTFKGAVDTYEDILAFRDAGGKSGSLDKIFAEIVTLLSRRNYSTASARLTALRTAIEQEKSKLAAAVVIPANVPAIKEAPSNGYRRQSVETPHGTFLVDVQAADLNSTRVQVETASADDCRDNCPVASLSDFVSRSGGFAGINGPYFCPAEYPSCAGKTNSFDTLLMNKTKKYFNSDNNVYSTVPAVIFSGNSARFVGASQEWGRDTGVDAVIASQPLLVSGGEVRFGGDGDPKKGSRGSRSFIGASGNTVYIGVVRGATVAEVAHVLKAMGVQNALNLDSGGSTAFMTGGKYVAGPGRNTPFGIVLVRK
jgi:hypothetical protein